MTKIAETGKQKPFLILILFLTFGINSTMPQSRQLAAIMFTDIVGYTALMGEDEQKAFELLHRNGKYE